MTTELRPCNLWQIGASMSDFSFVEAEHTILDFWRKEHIFQKSLDATKNGAPYIFYDGPPFATGLPHHGHLVASTIKDIIPRFFTMKGRYVTRRFGWDCHGLPIEHEIDKKLGMPAHEAVEKLGIAHYNKECRSIVSRYAKEWQKTIERVGRWVDFENDYKTMDLDYMESVWWVFKSAWDKGLIYQGLKVVPFSTALSTVLSNFEAGENYQEIQDPAVTVSFPVVGENFSLLAWTTTPWTLPMNQALCVRSDVDYELVEDKKSNKQYVLAQERLPDYQKKHDLVSIKTLKGSELVGLKYEPLFPFVEKFYADNSPPDEKFLFQVFADDYVTTEDGTGVVHQAPAFGEDDYRVALQAGLEKIFIPVDDEGRFSADVDSYQGQYFKDADKPILKDLKKTDRLFEHSVLVHNYPFCPRSDTPLMYKAVPSWYLAVEKVQAKMIECNQQINWVPSHLKNGRFGKWIEGARDWAISRNRIWGTPLPIWKNNLSGKAISFGSVAELEKLSGQKITDLHREFVDPISFEIDGEEGQYHRIPEVFDCWFESGSMPYAQLHYPFKNALVFESGFPAEFIAEGLDQTRGWFYTLTVLSAALFDRPAFKNVIVNGLVLAEDGKKMSKRLKNYTPPDELMEKFGADALRLFLINSGLVRGEELRFSDEGVRDMARRVLLPWLNSYKFLTTYAAIDSWNCEKDLTKTEHILDRWILSKLQTLSKTVNQEMQQYQLFNVVPALFLFLEDLTNWYIRLNRRRFWDDKGLTGDKKSAYSTLFQCVQTFGTLMAPFAPFLSEWIFQELKKLGKHGQQSVHLESFPEEDIKKQDSVLEDAVLRVQQIIILGRQQRNLKKIKVKTPLSCLTIIHRNTDVLEEIKKLSDVIQQELNVKSLKFETQEENYVELSARPNAPLLGKRLGKDFRYFAKKISALSNDELCRVEEGKTILIEELEFTPEELLVDRNPKEDMDVVSNRFISVSLDCKLTEDLRTEGLAREVINRIQKSRKEAGLEVSDRIRLSFTGDDKIIRAIKCHAERIKNETLSKEIHFVSLEQGHDAKIYEHEIDKSQFVIGMQKLDLPT